MICGIGYSQNEKDQHKKANEEIYKLIRESDKYNGSNDLKSLELANKACLLAEKIGTSRDKSISYALVANVLSSLGIYDKSFIYLEKSSHEPYAKTNAKHLAVLKAIKANNYWKLNLKTQAFDELKGVLMIADSKPKDYTLDFYKAQALRTIGGNYSEIGKQDSSLLYLNKAEIILKKFPKEETVIYYFEIPNIHLAKGDVFLQKQKLDSAFYYINSGFQIIKNSKEKSPTLHSFYFSFGDYYYQKKEYAKALNFYQKSIHEMDEHHINDTETKIEAFKNISEIYGLLNRYNEKEVYLNKYYKENEKLSIKNKENIEKAVNHIINEKKDEISFIEKRNNIWIFSIAFILIFISVLFYIIFKKANEKREKAILDLKIKEKIITEKEKQTKELKLKVNETFDEIVSLAKENHPNFYTRFQEVYPDLQRKILSINPNLQNSELVLLAYIYLNFETKEIADYTFKSPKTIQNRKHLLRKKLNIPSSEDMQVWLKSNVN